MPDGRAPGYAIVPLTTRREHDAQCPPLQLCGRLRPARSAPASTVSPLSTVNLADGMSVTCGMRAGCHEDDGPPARHRRPRVCLATWTARSSSRDAATSAAGWRRASAGSWQVVALARSAGTLAELRTMGIEAIAADFDAPAAPPSVERAADARRRRLPRAAARARASRIRGSSGFLAALGDARPPVLLYMSTTGVYGDTGGATVDERSDTGPGERPLAPQARGRTGRAATGATARGTTLRRAARARDLRAGSAAARSAAAATSRRCQARRLRPRQPHSRRRPRDRLHRSRRQPGSGAFNVSDGDHASTSEFLLKTASLAGLPPPRLVSRPRHGTQMSSRDAGCSWSSRGASTPRGCARNWA